MTRAALVRPDKTVFTVIEWTPGSEAIDGCALVMLPDDSRCAAGWLMQDDGTFVDPAPPTQDAEDETPSPPTKEQLLAQLLALQAQIAALAD